MKTIQSVSREMLDNLETAKRDNGSEYVRTKKTIEWQRDIIMKVHGDRFPDDSIYKFSEEALYLFVEIDEDETDEDRFEDAIHEQIEGDIYFYDLTAWLHDSTHNIWYLTEALEELDLKDGFQLLAAAQQRHKQEVASALLNAIVKHIEDSE